MDSSGPAERGGTGPATNSRLARASGPLNPDSTVGVRGHAGHPMNQHQVVIVPGDGIGPEVTEAVRRILEATHAPIAWVECRAGLGALEYGQDVLPQETLDTIRKHGVAVKGPCTTPIGEGFVSINVSLRKSLDLYAVRPIRNLEG